MHTHMAAQSFEALFGAIVADIDADMQAARAAQMPVTPMLWEIIDYQFGWDLGDEKAARRISGKKIRPLLMALVAQAVCGRYEHVLPAGTALEFIHNFTLIHDDVMDHSEERRHRPTVWTRWGAYQAINAGDGLYALGILAVTRLEALGTPPARIVGALRSLAQACLWTAEGQMLDMDFETRERVATTDYTTMVANKSATLIEAAAYCGALLSTDDLAVVDAYAGFGRSLGIAFQIRDDYLGVWGDEAITGKSATSDIREKKKSYPVLVALEQAGADDRAALGRIYAQDSLSDADVEAVLAILERVDAAAQTDRIASEYYDAALAHLERTRIYGAAQDLIRQYAAFLVRRAY
jgi:geranylgeranyl diphosphate synthase, type I